MPRFPKPWFRKDRNSWFVQLDGKQHNLGPDRELAFKRYHDLMAQPKKRKVPSETVPAVIDLFLDWCEKNRAKRTYEWYQVRCQAFVDTIPPDLRVADLRPHHLQTWVDSHAEWAPGNKRNACRSVQRTMNWAVKQGYIDRSPIAHFEKPPQGRREQIVTQAEFDSVLAITQDREFRDLIITTWETGARPQETIRVEARHVDLKNTRWVFPASESKMGRLPRVIYLSTEALDITKRLVLTYPTGPLFRNTRGKPWTADAVNCRFTTVQKKLGKRYSLYALRHSWATKALQNGVDPITVAVLMGHNDPSMLAKHYQHLSQDPNYLRDAVTRAIA